MNLLKRLPRVMVFDFLFEDGYALSCEDLVIGSPRELWAALHSEKFSVCYRPLNYDAATHECPGFNQFCAIGYARGDCWLVIDEAHQICNAHNIPVELLKIARIGRHQQVSLLYITQRFAMVEKTLTANTNTFAFFKITDPSDLEGIRMRCGKEVADQVQGLRVLDAERGLPGEVLLWSDSGVSQIFNSNSDNTTKVLLTGEIARVKVSEPSQGEGGDDAGATTDDLRQRQELRPDFNGDRRESPGPVHDAHAEKDDKHGNYLPIPGAR